MVLRLTPGPTIRPFTVRCWLCFEKHIKNIVKSENSLRPFSDQEIAEMLKSRNIDVARRTVAKYREALGILPSRKRKKLY